MVMDPAFQYDALGTTHFRLLILLPGEDTHNLKCNLVTMPFDREKMSYDAVSYAWHQHRLETSTSQLCTILCQQDDREGAVNITSNLREALLHFRHPKHHRTIWVDSICIDQRNLEERSHQVQRMAHIYREAETVLVWLGNDNGFASRAFQSLRMMAEGKHSQFRQNIELLGRLSQFSWFSRAWVIQEVVVARSIVVMCGIHTLDFTTLQAGFDAIRTRLDRRGIELLNDQSQHQAERMIPAMLLCQSVSHCLHYSKRGKRWGSRQTNSRLLKPSASKVVQLGLLLHNLRHCEATDARDKVYAFLGLSPRPFTMLQADYSISVEDLYTNVATAILNSGDLETLSLLYFVQTTNSQGNALQPATLPSWVPDWRYRAKMVTLGMSNIVRATGRARHPAIHFLSPQRISILGARLSQVTHITRFTESYETVFKANTFSAQGPDVAKRWVDSQSKDRTYPGSDLPYSEAYDMLSHGDWNMCTRRLKRQHIQLQLPNRALPMKHADVSTWNGLALKHGHVLVVTSDERLGWVPSSAEFGDQICLLFGAKVPFVIREIRNGVYKLIGGIYVPSIHILCPVRDINHI